MRTHIVLPDELVREVDEIVGPRKRSEFIEGALRDKLQRERQKWAIEHGAGILSAEDHPHWATAEKITEWLEKWRKVDIARSEEIWRDRNPLG